MHVPCPYILQGILFSLCMHMYILKPCSHANSSFLLMKFVLPKHTRIVIFKLCMPLRLNKQLFLTFLGISWDCHSTWEWLETDKNRGSRPKETSKVIFIFNVVMYKVTPKQTVKYMQFTCTSNTNSLYLWRVSTMYTYTFALLQVAKCLKKLETFEKELRQLRLLIDEVRRGVATYGIPGSGSRTTADGEASMVGVPCNMWGDI